MPTLISSQHDWVAEMLQTICLFVFVCACVCVHVLCPAHPISPVRQMASQKKAHDERRNLRMFPTTAQLEH